MELADVAPELSDWKVKIQNIMTANDVSKEIDGVRLIVRISRIMNHRNVLLQIHLNMLLVELQGGLVAEHAA